MDTVEANKEEEVAAPTLADPIVAPNNEGVSVEDGAVQTKAEEEPVIPTPPPLIDAQEGSPMPEPTSPPTPQPASEPMVTAATDDITITDQDVLFGRGGLTNRHIGNLRYRDIISIHRQDYVRASKTEKPHVARRIVKAIRTGKNPGRFLKRSATGKWVEVSDQEAAWKASQALREKSRWSSMRHQDSVEDDVVKDMMQPLQPLPAAPIEAGAAAVSSIVRMAAALGNAESFEEPMKRKALKRAKSEPPAEQHHTLPMAPVESVAGPALMMPELVSDIIVPPMTSLEDIKVGANYALPATGLNTCSADICPNEEDVLFGRGGRTNHHPGNKRLREIVNRYRDVYHQAKKIDKPKVSRLIVSALLSANPPSRFLRMNEETAKWEEVHYKRAAEKVSQTLREKDRDHKAEYLAKKEKFRGAMVPQEVREAISYAATLEAAAEAAAAAEATGETKVAHLAEVVPTSPEKEREFML